MDPNQPTVKQQSGLCHARAHQTLQVLRSGKRIAATPAAKAARPGATLAPAAIVCSQNAAVEVRAHAECDCFFAHHLSNEPGCG